MKVLLTNELFLLLRVALNIQSVAERQLPFERIGHALNQLIYMPGCVDEILMIIDNCL